MRFKLLIAALVATAIVVPLGVLAQRPQTPRQRRKERLRRRAMHRPRKRGGCGTRVIGAGGAKTMSSAR